jgi:hypothetical protein
VSAGASGIHVNQSISSWPRVTLPGKVHGPATAQQDGGADALGNLDRFGNQLKLTSEAF